MKIAHEILRALGRIEGELIEIRKLNERVSKLETWHINQCLNLSRNINSGPQWVPIGPTPLRSLPCRNPVPIAIQENTRCFHFPLGLQPALG